jgi:lambda family phage minor tail protein L
MPTSAVSTETTKLTPSSIIQLFILDATNIGASDLLYFHNGSNGLYRDVIFAGQSYVAFPIETEGFEIDGKGQLPRPKLRAANIQGFISTYLNSFDDLVGAKVTRRKVFAKYLDVTNFPNNINPFGTADPTAAFPDEIFYIDRKLSENRIFVEWELVTPLEAPQAKLPNRIMLANQCIWKYRGFGTCGYAGVPVADYANKKFATSVGSGGYGFTLNDRGEWSSAATYNAGDYVYIVSTLELNAGERFYYVCRTNGTTGSQNKPNASQGISTTPWIADACSKLVTGCKCRFATGDLPFGGWQGIARVPFMNR